MNAASEEYVTTITAEMRCQESTLIISNLKSAMYEYYRLTIKKEDNKIGLAATEMKCYLCSQPDYIKKKYLKNHMKVVGAIVVAEIKRRNFLTEHAISVASKAKRKLTARS